MTDLTRRDFLTLAAGATALGIPGSKPACSAGARGLPDPRDAPFDTVVVLMMENRSFDHLLGWMPGANGRQQGLRYTDVRGVVHETWPLAPEWQGCMFNGATGRRDPAAPGAPAEALRQLAMGS